MKKNAIILLIIFTIIAIQAASLSEEPSNKAELGKILFFDPILSRDSTVSCASCHKPAFAFADNSAISTGVKGKKGIRNSPSVMNVVLRRPLFWDGRAKTLEEQALIPIENPLEMDLPIKEVVERLQKSKSYSSYFKRIFNEEPTAQNLAQALTAFERTLETNESAFDRWKFSDDSTMVTKAAKRGFVIFNGKGKCVTCHFGADMTTNEFRNIGLFNGKELNDSGRAAISGNINDLGKFKVPSLRNIAVTAPYMHNGMFKTLKEVIEFYNEPDKHIGNAVNRDSLLAKPLQLTRREKKDLEAFLLSLTDQQFITKKNNRR